MSSEGAGHDEPRFKASLTGRGNREGIGDPIRAYWRWAKSYYQPTESATLKVGLRLLRQYYGATRAVEFGPTKLRLLRDAMIRGDENGDSPRMPWSRGYINAHVRRIRSMFRWAASHELIPVSVHQGLATVEPLKRGRTAAREGKKVGPAPMHLVQGCRPYLSRQVNAIIDLQLLTGARCGEVVIMRPIDIDMSENQAVHGEQAGRTWTYRPTRHKNEHRGKDRVIFLGPKAQEVLKPFLADRRVDDFLFNPREAETERRARLAAERVTPLSCGNKAGSNVKENPRRSIGLRYTSASYLVAIRRACEQACTPPVHLRPRELKPGKFESKGTMLARLTPAERSELKAFIKANRWHPHQRRHNAATAIRQQFGLEAAQLVLGHSSAALTDAVYAERDGAKIAGVIGRVG